MASNTRKKSPTSFQFARLDSIGAAAAEDDEHFLSECFVETESLSRLLDTDDPRRIVVGRTGAGKTALLLEIAKRCDRAIMVEPENLALAHISNSTILRFFDGLGVDMDVFFKLLWRHVLVVELLRRHFDITSQKAARRFFDQIKDIFRNRRHQKAIEYLRQWGERFWEETEYRTTELTSKLENELKASVGGKKGVQFGADYARRLSKEEKVDLVQRAQSVVNKVQIQELSQVLDLLNDVLADPQKRYYLVVDRLDESWVEDALRIRLIRALIGTSKDFSKVQNAKVIVALRLDLIRRVFRQTRKSGFQDEKFSSLYLHLEWDKRQLESLLDQRLAQLVKHRYQKKTEVTHKTVLPRSVDKKPYLDYMLSRTFMRPRDVITFVNASIRHAPGKGRVPVTAVRKAEGEYSRERMRSLCDEWESDYPNLGAHMLFLKGRHSRFSVGDIERTEAEDFCLEQAVDLREDEDILSATALAVANGHLSYSEYLRISLGIFYLVGLVGLKISAAEAYSWSMGRGLAVSDPEIVDSTRVEIHAAFWRVLGIRPS